MSENRNSHHLLNLHVIWSLGIMKHNMQFPRLGYWVQKKQSLCQETTALMENKNKIFCQTLDTGSMICVIQI